MLRTRERSTESFPKKKTGVLLVTIGLIWPGAAVGFSIFMAAIRPSVGMKITTEEGKKAVRKRRWPAAGARWSPLPVFADPKTLTKEYLRMKRVRARLFAPAVFCFIGGWLGNGMERVAPQNRITEMTSPILLIHWEGDRYIRPSNMEILYNRASGNADGGLIPRRSHSGVMHDLWCTRAMVLFSEANLHPDRNRATVY